MSAESLQPREQSTPEEIEQFLALAHAPYRDEEPEFTFSREFLTSVIGIRHTDDGYHYVRHASQDGALGRFYLKVYPGSSERERYGIAWADLAAIARTHYLLWDSENDPSARMFDADKGLFDEAVLGMSLDEKSQPSFPVRRDILEESGLYRQRLEQGMPRVMQLFVATQAVDRFENSSDWRHGHANAFYHLPELWNLSDEETKAVTRLAASYDKRGANVLSLITADERLLERYREEDGTLDIDKYGGPEALLKTARQAFERFVRWGQDSKDAVEWLELDAALGDQLAEVFPYEARQELAYKTWIKHPIEPSEALQTYITLEEAANLSRLYIQEQIDKSDSEESERREIGRRRVAINMGLSKQIIDGATYWDHKNMFTLIDNHADPEERDLHDFLNHYRQAAEEVDEELAGYLDDYAAVIRSGDLVWPVQGWSGAPEEEEVVLSLSARRDRARQKMHEAENAVRHKINAAKSSTG